jgi:DNA-binding transcriptional MerR regulator
MSGSKVYGMPHYSLQDLSDQSGIELRTIRSYIQSGILQRPSSSGRGAYYGDEHLNRLKAMRVLRERERKSLDEVRGFFLTSSDAEIAAKAAELPDLPVLEFEERGSESSAADYLARLKESLGGSWTGQPAYGQTSRQSIFDTTSRQSIFDPTSRQLAYRRTSRQYSRASSSPSTPRNLGPLQRAISVLASLTGQTRPPSTTRHSAWSRFEIVPGVELQVDESLGLDPGEIGQLCDHIRVFIQGGLK